MVIHFRLPWLLPIACCFCSHASDGAPLRDARLSQVVREVLVSHTGTAPVTGRPEAPMRDASLRTGPKSRAELSFADRTVVRLGDHTDLSFDSGSRTLNLSSGAVLTQVPTGVGGTQLRVRSITATVTGTTLLAECMPEAYSKFICLDGTSRLCLKGSGWAGDCILLRPGQMLIVAPGANTLPEAVDVDLSRLVETSQFITEFGALPDQARVLKAAANQRKLKSRGNFADTDLVIFGRGTIVSRSSPDNAGRAAASPSSSPKQNSAVPQ